MTSKFLPERGENLLLNNKIKNCKFLKEGWRGKIYKGEFKEKDVIIKIARIPSLSEKIRKEGEIIERVNIKNIGPKLLLYGFDFIITEFIEGTHLKEFFNSPSPLLQNILEEILIQARELDKLNISKDEMHRPYTNIIVSKNKPVLIDFESSKITDKPQNVTQFVSFWLSYLRTQIKPIEANFVIDLLRKYKKNYSEDTFLEIVGFFREKQETIMKNKKI